jgi:murein DD-endopeptidase MepM/ murein hydrolase activator NlpD
MQPMPAPISAARRAVTPDVLSVPNEAPVTLAKKAIVKPIKKFGALVLDDTVTGAVEATPQRVVKAVKQPLPIADDVAIAEPTQIKKPKLGSKPRVLGPVDDTADAAPLPEKTVASVKPATSGKYVTVAAGDTIYSIANRVHKPSTKILAANHLPSGTALKVGQKLLIPDATTAALDTTTTGSISTDTPLEKAPLPVKTPKRETVAVLPTVPQVKGKATAKDAVATAAPAKPLSVKSKLPAGSYAVASGDSLYTIAELKTANNVEDGKLKIGQALKIPAKGATVVAAAKPVINPGIDPIVTGSAATSTKKKLGPVVEDTVAPAPAKVPVAAPATPSNEAITEAEKDTAAAPDATGISKLRWPVRGRTLTSFGQSGDGGHANDGVDISVPNGTPVKAAENGVVIYAGTGLKDFGNTVLVRHENGLVTVYGNNGEISVKRGEKVKRGQELAKSGMSGNTKVPKLHFEVRKNSTPVNPTGYLE